MVNYFTVYNFKIWWVGTIRGIGTLAYGEYGEFHATGGATGWWMMKLDKNWPKTGWFDCFCLDRRGVNAHLDTPMGRLLEWIRYMLFITKIKHFSDRIFYKLTLKCLQGIVKNEETEIFCFYHVFQNLWWISKYLHEKVNYNNTGCPRKLYTGEAEFFFFETNANAIYHIACNFKFYIPAAFSRISNYESVTFLTKVIACVVSLIKFPCFLNITSLTDQF